jgi:hypothetical protein
VLAPIIDLGLRRRAWVLIGNIGFGICAAGSLLLLPYSLAAVTAALFAGFAMNNLTAAGLGALLAALPASIHGRASGWFQTGNVGLGAVAGGVAVWFASRFEAPALAVGTMLVVGISLNVVLLVQEPARERISASPCAVSRIGRCSR